MPKKGSQAHGLLKDASCLSTRGFYCYESYAGEILERLLPGTFIESFSFGGLSAAHWNLPSVLMPTSVGKLGTPDSARLRPYGWVFRVRKCSPRGRVPSSGDLFRCPGRGTREKTLVDCHHEQNRHSQTGKYGQSPWVIAKNRPELVFQLAQTSWSHLKKLQNL